MAWTSRRLHGAVTALLLLLAPLTAHAQALSNVPDLSTATQTSATSAKSTDETTQTSDSDAKTTQDADSTSSGSTFAATTTTADGPAAASTTLTNDPVHLSDIPTLAGVGIPTIVVPYTANAPYMRKSNLPEGTFFIAVGAVLAFCGACVLIWRGMVAWSINRSVKRTAMLASMNTSSEKTGRTTSSYWGGPGNAGYNRVSTAPGGIGGMGKHNSFYATSSVSLDNLTAAGKPVKPHFRDSVAERNASSGAPAPPAHSQDPSQLFFSPTRQAQSNRDSQLHLGQQGQRNSSYMPSGFYASPNSHVGNGRDSVHLGAPHTNTNRHSAFSSNASPPSSPGLRPQSRKAPGSREGLRNSAALGTHPSSSSLMVGGQSSSDLAGSRAPSAYLEDLFDNHGSGPRERY